MRLVERTKRCTGPCGLVKPWSEYHASRKWEDGTMRNPQARCKACHRIVSRGSIRSAESRERHRQRCAERRAEILADPELRAAANARWRQYLRGYRAAQGKESRPYRWLENTTSPLEAPSVPAAPLFAWMERHGLTQLLVRDRSGVGEWAFKVARTTGVISLDDVDRILQAFGFSETIDDLYPEALAA